MEMSIEAAAKEYTFVRKHGKIHIKEYIGNGGSVEIPQFIGGMPVTKIGYSAFNGSDITDIIIPDGVRCIGNGAFMYCNKLKKITLLGRIDFCSYVAFYGSSLEEIEGIEYLAASNVSVCCFMETPFYEANETLIIGDKLIWCREISEIIYVPEHIRKIGSFAFYESKAKRIVLPKNLKEIGNHAFFRADIREIDIPDSVEKMGGCAFSWCRHLKKVRFPQDFGRRIGWTDYPGVSDNIINDTQIHPSSDDDILVYDNVSCIICEKAMTNNNRRVIEKQIFPERLEYLKCVRLLASAKVNVFKNDTFVIEREEDIFDDFFPCNAINFGRRFTVIFDFENVYAEVLFWFPFVPFYPRNYCLSGNFELTRFYSKCLVNGRDGKFFDFENYDGHILEQDIPFRIKAEIAYKRFKSNYRLSEKAAENYKQYFGYHRKKLYVAFDKLQNDEMKRFFEENIL